MSAPVGYGNPPAHRRFQKGQSGNPAGRPKGSANLATQLMRALKERVAVSSNGRVKTISKLEAIATQLTNKSASGDLAAIRLLTQLLASMQAEPSESGKEGLSEVDRKVIAEMLKRAKAVQGDGGDGAG
ncbi:MAG TPA: DUF5681 domain-containing protein [Stellaceae bacterium]|nr:DUF5681 domain-containing protein [Stellaceae bacterium]